VRSRPCPSVLRSRQGCHDWDFRRDCRETKTPPEGGAVRAATAGSRTHAASASPPRPPRRPSSRTVSSASGLRAARRSPTSRRSGALPARCGGMSSTGMRHGPGSHRGSHRAFDVSQHAHAGTVLARADCVYSARGVVADCMSANSVSESTLTGLLLRANCDRATRVNPALP